MRSQLDLLGLKEYQTEVSQYSTLMCTTTKELETICYFHQEYQISTTKLQFY